MLRLRLWMLPLAGALFFLANVFLPVEACCPAPPPGQVVLNADQTIVVHWDKASKTEHFIRKATFKSDSSSFGFLIPSPSQPELNESGAEAFPLLAKITAPEVERRARPRDLSLGCGCGSNMPLAAKSAEDSRPEVRVLEEKFVAGFKASVLEADTAGVLLEWLKENGFDFSAEVKAWAEPYVEAKWKITALKVAGATAEPKTEPGDVTRNDVEAPALRMSFKTEVPLFPYREPDSAKASEKLKWNRRLLRIYFVGEQRYLGELENKGTWTGKTAYANALTAEQRAEVLKQIKLPETAAPASAWLTEFEDPWPYAKAPGDLRFKPSDDTSVVKRPPIIEYYDAPRWPIDAAVCAIGLAMAVGVILMVKRWLKGPAA
ncbi:MAG: DUF2330 domain-containing protein [Planctomycetota bacterium]|nr:DUF2330 domain-containing protein [Planctomycetota bacterium]